MDSHSTTQGGPPDQHPDGAFLIDGPADQRRRERAEKKRTKKARRNLQLFFNGCLALTTVGLALIGGYQAVVSRRAADAATAAANAAKDTLAHMKVSGAQTSQQTQDLIAATSNLANAAKDQAGSMKELAGRALAQAQATNTLAAESKRAADIAEAQRASPWVGIERDTFKLEGPKYDWSGPGVPTIGFQAQFSVKNFGSAPALHYLARMNTVPVPFTPFYVSIPEWGDDEVSTSQAADPRRVRACPLTESDAAIKDYRKGGSMILPGETRRDQAGSSIVEEVRPKALGPVWTALCITYFGPGGELHHSGYGFMSVFDVTTAKPIAFPDHPGWSFLPLNPPILIQSNAN